MWMAKSSRLGAKGSFVIRERRVLELYCVSSQALRLLWYVPYCTVLKYDTVQYIPNSYVLRQRIDCNAGILSLIVWTTTPCICSTRILGNLYKNSWPQFEQIKTCFSSKLYFIFQFFTDGSNFRWALLNGKVRPLGLRGRTPYKVMQGSVCILAFFHVLRALATTEKSLQSSNCLVMCVHGTPHAVSCLRSALRLW